MSNTKDLHLSVTVRREHVFISSFNRCSSLPTILYIFISICCIKLSIIGLQWKHLHRYRLLSLKYCFSTKQVFRSHLWVIRYTHSGWHSQSNPMNNSLKKWGGKQTHTQTIILKQWGNIICLICGTGRFALTMSTAQPLEMLRGDKCDCLCRVLLCVPLAPLLRILPEFGAVIVIELSFCPVLLQKEV